MKKFTSRLLQNALTQTSMVIAGFGGLLSDAYLGREGFYVTFILSLLLFIWAIYDEYKRQLFYKNTIIPIPVVISVDDAKPLNAIFTSIVKEIEKNKQFIGIEKHLRHYFGISKEELLFEYKGDLYDNQRLISFLQIIRYSLTNVEKRMDNRVQFHIAYLRRPAIGIALGGMFRSDGIVVYQNNDYQDRFDKVATIDSRQYKEKIERYEKFERIESFKRPEECSLLLVIQLSSHNVVYTHEAFAHLSNRVVLQSKGNGTIALDEDWVRYAQEIYNTINDLRRHYTHITIAHSMPEAVAIILGMALENYWQINVTQYDNEDYKQVIMLNTIKYHF